MRRPGPGGVLAALPPLAVLAVDPGGAAPFGPAKWLVVPALGLAGIAAVATRRVRVAPAPTVAWAALLLVVLAAAAGGLDPLYAWTGTPERHFGALTWLLAGGLFVAGQSLGDRGRTVALGAALAAGALGAWAAAETLGWAPFDVTGAGSRPIATFGSSAYLGAAAVLLGPVAVGLAADAGVDRRVRRAAGVGGGLAGLALVTSGARAAWVGAAVAAALVAWRRPAARRLLGGAVVAAVALALVTGVAGRLPDAFDDDRGGAGGRLDEWRVATRVVADHPLLGTGPEGYRIAFGAAVDDAYEQEHGRDPLPDRAHSAVLDVAATIGLPGLAAYLVLLVLTARVVLPALRRDPSLAGIAAGLAAYAVQSLFLFPLAELDPLFWLLAGLVVGQVGSTIELRVPRAVPMLTGALSAAALVAGGLDLVADRRAAATLEHGTEPVGAARLRPDAVRYRLVAARAYAGTGSSIGLDRALAELDRALDVSPRDPVAGAERAALLLARAQRSGVPAHAEAARRALDRLLACDPRNAETLLRAGVARALTGDLDGAEDAWLAAERLAPASAAASVDLALAYERAGRLDDARAAARRALRRDPGAEPQALLRRLAGT